MQRSARRSHAMRSNLGARTVVTAGASDAATCRAGAKRRPGEVFFGPPSTSLRTRTALTHDRSFLFFIYAGDWHCDERSGDGRQKQIVDEEPTAQVRQGQQLAFLEDGGLRAALKTFGSNIDQFSSSYKA